MTCNSGYDRWRYIAGPPEPTDEQEEAAELLGNLTARADEAAKIVEAQDEIGIGITSQVRDDMDGNPVWKLQFEIEQPVKDADDMICLALDVAKAVKVFADAVHDY